MSAFHSASTPHSSSTMSSPTLATRMTQTRVLVKLDMRERERGGRERERERETHTQRDKQTDRIQINAIKKDLVRELLADQAAVLCVLRAQRLTSHRVRHSLVSTVTVCSATVKNGIKFAAGLYFSIRGH